MPMSRCKECGVEFEFTIPREYCDSCKQALMANPKKKRLCVCRACGHTWTPRGVSATPTYCPNCFSREWKGQSAITRARQKPIITCQYCGDPKQGVRCKGCGRLSTENTHRLGIPVSYFEKLEKFVFEVNDPEDMLLVLFREALKAYRETAKGEQVVEIPNPEQVQEQVEPIELDTESALKILDALSWN